MVVHPTTMVPTPKPVALAGRVRFVGAPLTRGQLVALALLASLGPAVAGCDRNGPLDTVIDTATDAGVWRDDATKILAALPHAVSSFKPSESAEPFVTSYRTGPVFGASATYADGPRQLVLRIESGNIRERAATLAKGHTNPGEAFVTREARVHGQPATVHWDSVGKTADIVVVLQRRFLVELRLVPAQGDDEVQRLAEAMDVAPLEALTLDGVKP